MSKDTWIAVVSAAFLVLLVVLFGSTGPFAHPEPVPHAEVSLRALGEVPAPPTVQTSTSTLVASPATVGQKATTPKKTVDVIPPGLAVSLGKLRDALVNIICAAEDGSVRSVSGSGVIISPDGLIVTNAHIAQMFLLRNYPKKNNVLCVIRTGNPARTAYLAELVYISPSWIRANADTLTTVDPKGTGKDDFALLAVTSSATDKPLPVSFPFVPVSTDDTYDVNEPVAIGSYGAQTLTSTQIKKYLYPTLVFGSIKDQFTFNTDTVDVIALGGSAVAQEGSSGGGVVNTRGELVAVISTSSVVGDLLTRDLHAITVDHLRRSFRADMGSSLDAYLTNVTPAKLVVSFKPTSLSLTNTLVGALR